MWEYFLSLDPVAQALLAGIFTWGMTAFGAATAFLTREVNRKFLDVMLGFAGGVMIAASFWSLLLPAIEMSVGGGVPKWLPPAIGFILGGIAIAAIGRILPHFNIGFLKEDSGRIPSSWHRSTLLIIAITMHNIPEGLAVGVAFGALAAGYPVETLAAAVTLAIAIGIQNVPEGMAISLPLRREGFSVWRSFWYGQLSGLVEPLMAVAGAAAVIIAKPILPYALAFAAGAMIFVVIQEVVPESQRNGNEYLATYGAMLGFVVMMILDVGLG